MTGDMGARFTADAGSIPAAPDPLKQVREEHMRTALILGRCAEMLDAALHRRATFEVREEAYDLLAQSRRRLRDLDQMLWPDPPSKKVGS